MKEKDLEIEHVKKIREMITEKNKEMLGSGYDPLAYRMSSSRFRLRDWQSFVKLANLPPEKGWELTEAGFNCYTGMPLKLYSRQVSKGFFLTSEESFDEISYDELAALSHEQINKDNWRDFIPKDDDFQKKMSKPFKRSTYYISAKDLLPCSETVTAYYIREEQAFGTHYYYFRKCSDGWHAFTTYSGPYDLFNDEIPSEEEITRIFDRLLFEDAHDSRVGEIGVRYFFHELHERKPGDNKCNNDIYGSARTYIYQCDGKNKINKIETRGFTGFSNRMAEVIEHLAKDIIEKR